MIFSSTAARGSAVNFTQWRIDSIFLIVTDHCQQVIQLIQWMQQVNLTILLKSGEWCKENSWKLNVMLRVSKGLLEWIHNKSRVRKLEWINFMHSEYCFIFVSPQLFLCRAIRWEFSLQNVSIWINLPSREFIFLFFNQSIIYGWLWLFLLHHITIKVWDLLSYFSNLSSLHDLLVFIANWLSRNHYFFIGNFCNRWHFIIIVYILWKWVECNEWIRNVKSIYLV